MLSREEITTNPSTYTMVQGLSEAELSWYRSMAIEALGDDTLKWRHNGQGMLQAYLIEGSLFEARIHVWHAELQKPGIAENGLGHDHRFDMTSFVILGGLKQQEIILEPCEQNSFHVCRLLECTHAREAKVTGSYHMDPVQLDGYVRTSSQDFFIREAKYTFPKFRFHRSTSIGSPTVSIVLKSNQSDDKARILDQFSKRPLVNAFDDIKIQPEFQHILDSTRAMVQAANDG